MRWARLALLAAPVVLVSEGPARAAQPTVSARVDRPVVGLGDVVAYSVELRSDHELEVQVSPGKLDGFDVIGTQSMPGRFQSDINGVVTTTLSITVTFKLRAKKLGTHALGPGSFRFDKQVLAAPTVKVQVVPKSDAPKPPSPFGSPFGSPFDDLFFQDEPPPPPPPQAPIEPVDPLAKLDEVPPLAGDTFARTVVEPSTAVVGAQTTTKVFVYSRRQSHAQVKRPPGFTELRNVPLGTIDKRWHPIMIAGERWNYAALEGWAAFPLRTGKLTVGPAEVETSIPDAFGDPAFEHTYSTAPVEIEAVEPPAEGRPPGYVLGDVVEGLEIAADVAPRVVKDGHALVTLKMKGAGRLDPLRPLLPTPPGVTWTSTYDDTRTAIEGLVVRGVRKASFDAKLDHAGEVDLGEAVVHVWDPKRHAYVTARAPLGKVKVETPAGEPAKTDAPALAELPSPRGSIGARGDGKTLADRAWPWLVVVGAPLGVVLAQGAAAALRRRRARRGENDATAEAQARSALDAAKRCEREGRRDEATAALGRALDRALEARTGVRARGLGRSALAQALSNSSLDAALRTQVLDAFDALEAARFAGSDAADVAKIGALVERLLETTRPAA